MGLEHGWEDDAVEYDVVLADEVHQTCLGILPPGLPTAQFGTCIAEFLGIADITNGSVEPHVEHLAVGTLHGNGDTPVQVACHGTGVQTSVQPTLALAVHVGSPFLVLLQNPLLQPLLVLVQGQIPVLGFLLHQGVARLGIVGVDEFLGRERCTALLALVAVGIGGMATGALALDVAVGEEASCSLVKELLRHLLHELALLIEFLEEVAGKLMVYGSAGARVDIEGDAELLEGVLDDAVVSVHHLLHADALLAGTDCYGHTMLVAATYEQHVAPLQSQVAHIYVCRHIHASQVSDVHGTVGIGQSRSDGSSLEILFHFLSYILFCPQRYYNNFRRQSRD